MARMEKFLVEGGEEVGEMEDHYEGWDVDRVDLEFKSSKSFINSSLKLALLPTLFFSFSVCPPVLAL